VRIRVRGSGGECGQGQDFELESTPLYSTLIHVLLYSTLLYSTLRYSNLISLYLLSYSQLSTQLNAVSSSILNLMFSLRLRLRDKQRMKACRS
jgi:hypothetical protein